MYDENVSSRPSAESMLRCDHVVMIKVTINWKIILHLWCIFIGLKVSLEQLLDLALLKLSLLPPSHQQCCEIEIDPAMKSLIRIQPAKSDTPDLRLWQHLLYLWPLDFGYSSVFLTLWCVWISFISTEGRATNFSNKTVKFLPLYLKDIARQVNHGVKILWSVEISLVSWSQAVITGSHGLGADHAGLCKQAGEKINLKFTGRESPETGEEREKW